MFGKYYTEARVRAQLSILRLGLVLNLKRYSGRGRRVAIGTGLLVFSTF